MEKRGFVLFSIIFFVFLLSFLGDQGVLASDLRVLLGDAVIPLQPSSQTVNPPVKAEPKDLPTTIIDTRPKIDSPKQQKPPPGFPTQQSAPTHTGPQPSCYLQQARWETTRALQGAQVRLYVYGQYCKGETIPLTIYEEDLLYDDEVTTLQVTFHTDTLATVDWVIHHEDTDYEGNNLEFYFTAALPPTTSPLTGFAVNSVTRSIMGDLFGEGRVSSAGDITVTSPPTGQPAPPSVPPSAPKGSVSSSLLIVPFSAPPPGAPQPARAGSCGNGLCEWPEEDVLSCQPDCRPSAIIPATADYYVGPANICDDLGNGNRTNPFCTVTDGSSFLQPGETLLILNGTYKEFIQIDASGTPGNPIRIVGSRGAVFEGGCSPHPCVPTNFAGRWKGLLMIDLHDVIVEGFTLQNYASLGLEIIRGENIVVNDMHLERIGGSGMVIRNTTNSQITHNELMYVNLDAIDQTTGLPKKSGQEGLTIAENNSNIIVRGNHVKDTWYEGISIKSSTTRDLIVYENYVQNTCSGLFYISEGSNYTIYHNKLLYGGFFNPLPTSLFNYSAYHCRGPPGCNHPTFVPVPGETNVKCYNAARNIYRPYNNKQQGPGFAINVYDLSRTGRGSLANVEIRENMISTTHRDCISSFDHYQTYNRPRGNMTNISIHDNTLYNCSLELGPGSAGTGIFIDAAMKNPNIGNNIIAYTKDAAIGAQNRSAIFVPFNNLYWQNDLVSSNTFFVKGVNFIEDQDPLLMNPSIFDFRLTENSPARDAGLYVGYPFMGSAPDIGAHEFAGLSVAVSPQLVELLPNTVFRNQSTLVFLIGDGFDPSSFVLLYNQTYSQAQVINATLIQMTIPPTMALGVHQVKVRNPGSGESREMSLSVNEPLGLSGPTNPACQFPGALLPVGGTPTFTSKGAIMPKPHGGFDPTVLWNGQAQLFELWFSNFIWAPLEHPPSGWTGFAYATSPDGINWTILINETNGKPAHIVNPTQSFPISQRKWDYDNVEVNNVVVNSQTGEYILMYGSYPGIHPNGTVLNRAKEGRIQMLGMTKGDNGTTQKRPSPNPNMMPSLFWEQPYQYVTEENATNVTRWEGGLLEPAILWNGTHYELWYQANSKARGPLIRRNVGYATSTDAVNWQKHPLPVFSRDLTAGWERSQGPNQLNVMYDPQDPQGKHLFYASGSGGHVVGHAYSEDGKSWTRNPNNPLMQRVSGFAYGSPTAVWKDDKIYVWVMRNVQGSPCCKNMTFRMFTANCTLPVVPSPPQLNSLSPSNIFNNINNIVNLTGDDFDPGASVLIDSTTHPSFSSQVINATFIELSVLSGLTPKAYGISVKNPNGNVSQELPLNVQAGGGSPTPVINSLIPPRLPSTQISLFNVAGINFEPAAKLFFAGVELVNPQTGTPLYVYVNATHITAGMVAGIPPAPYPVYVENPGPVRSNTVTLTITPCLVGEQRLCAQQQGVCGGSMETCDVNGNWPGCGQAEYQSNAQVNFGVNYQQGVETLCDGEDNNCDGQIDNIAPANAELCANQVGVCAGSVKSCGGRSGWQSCPLPSFEQGALQCSDGLDNDCDGEADYDGFTGGIIVPAVHGDAGCPVGVTNLQTVTNICPGTQFAVICTTTVSNVNSVAAELDGQACIFNQWVGNDADFTCTAQSLVGTQTASCTVDLTKSYQSGSNQTASISVGGIGCCSQYGTQASCGAASCEWCFECDPTPTNRKSSGPTGIGDRCVASGTCTYVCDITNTNCGATCDNTNGGCSVLQTCNLQACSCQNNQPTLTQLTPGTIFNNINNTVNLTGSNFDPGAIVLIDNKTNPNFSSSILSTTLAQLSVLAGTPAVSYQIKVQNPDGQETKELPLSVTQGGGAANRPPVLNPIGNKNVTENVLLLFQVTATDPDNNTLVYTANNLPLSAVFGAQIFSWRPTLGQAGVYRNVEFVVTDTGIPPLSDREIITIFVNASLDDDNDGVPNNLDCNDNNPLIGECTGCAECSDPQGINGTCVQKSGTCGGIKCPPSFCAFGACTANQTAVFSANETQTCSIVNSIGTCQPQQCTPLRCQAEATCNMDSDCDNVPDFMDQCPRTPPGCPIGASKVNIYSGCRLPNVTKFSPNLSTNFSSSFNLRSIPNLKLGIYGGGVIEFTNPIPVMQFSSKLNYYNPLNLDEVVFLAFNNASVDPGNVSGNETSNFSMFNQPATITLFGLPFTTPEVLVDGFPCTACTILSYVNGDLIFTVPGFSEYSGMEASSSAGGTGGGGTGRSGGGGSRGGGYGKSGTSITLDLDEKPAYSFSVYKTTQVFIIFDTNLYSIQLSANKLNPRHLDLYTNPNGESLTIRQGDELNINIDTLPDEDIAFTLESISSTRVSLIVSRLNKNIASIQYPYPTPIPGTSPSIKEEKTPELPVTEEEPSRIKSWTIRIASFGIGLVVVFLLFVMLHVSRKKEPPLDI